MSELAPVETSAMISVAQIVDGSVQCHCGEDAVLVVTTEPDGEPGAACYEHARHWIGLVTNMTDRLFGPERT